MRKIAKKIVIHTGLIAICFIGAITVFAITSTSKPGTATYLSSVKLSRIDIAGTPGTSTSVGSHIKATQYTEGGASIKTTFDIYSASGAFNSSKSAVTNNINNTTTIYYQMASGVLAGWKADVSFKGKGPTDQVVGTFGAYS